MAAGATMQEIANEMGRSQEALRNRALKLGLLGSRPRIDTLR
jgi:hypothetical protein